MMLLCASFGVFASFFLLIGLAIDCRQLLLPWILTMIADAFVEASHFIYVVFFEKVRVKQIINQLLLRFILSSFQVEIKVLTAFIFTVDFFVMLLNVSEPHGAS